MDADRFDNILVGLSATVRETIEHIDAGRAHLALVVDDNRRLLGTITDGDIRRALLHGVELDDPIDGILQRGPVTATSGATEDELLELLTANSIEQVPIVEGDRVVDVVLLRDLVHDPRRHSVVIVAGGEGKRLRPLTETVPKPMLDVGGKPLLERVLGDVRDAGFQQVFLLVNYRADAIEEHFGSGEEVGLDLHYVHEPEPLGSAGGLHLVRSRLDRPFVVMNADLVTDIDFGALLKFHETEANVVTIAVKQYVLEVPFGVVDLDGTRVDELREKPELKFFVNAGIYALSPEAVDFLPGTGDAFHMTDLIAVALERGARVGGFPVREYWLDIGHVADYERANEDVATRFRAAG